MAPGRTVAWSLWTSSRFSSHEALCGEISLSTSLAPSPTVVKSPNFGNQSTMSDTTRLRSSHWHVLTQNEKATEVASEAKQIVLSCFQATLPQLLRGACPHGVFDLQRLELLRFHTCHATLGRLLTYSFIAGKAFAATSACSPWADTSCR